MCSLVGTTGEVNTQAADLRRFYVDVMNWNLDGSTAGAWSTAGSARGHLTFAVTRAEMLRAFERVNAAGGRTLLAPTWIPGMHTVALMADPHGNTVGLIAAGAHV